jgi:UDP-N-acetylglucosamine 4,6-dehydratase
MKSIVITGGTGSLGHALVARLIKEPEWSRICILSRDELKQASQKDKFPDPRIHFFLGDVRDRDRLEQAFHGIDIVIHAAALKRIDAVAYDPEEVLKTNVLGTLNVLSASMKAGVKQVLFISTDKACEPANVYGNTKMMAESLVTSYNTYSFPRGMHCSAVRYGNVWRSRGSVLHVWDKAVREGKPIPITDYEMTRFIITLDQAVSLVLDIALNSMFGGEIFIPKLPSVYMRVLLEAYLQHVYSEDTQYASINTIGLRPGGEKMHEKLIATEEMFRTVDMGPAYVVTPTHHSWTSVGWMWPKVKPFIYQSDCVEKLSDGEILALLGEG